MIFQTPDLSPEIWRLLERIEKLRAKLSYGVNTRRWSGFLARVMLARAIQGSNSIEGYNVTIDDAMAAADGESPVDMGPEHETWAAITGYRDAMTYSLKLSDDPHFDHSATLIRSLHYMVQKYDQRKHPGQWRHGPIYVRNDDTGETVYEGPEADRIPELVTELVQVLNGPPSETPVMVRGAMAHLNLVMIHPFADGNGRMARCLQTLVLAREGIMAPQFCSIEEYLGRFRDEYYAVLATVGAGRWHPERDAAPWIKFCLDIHLRQALTLLRRNRELAKLWEALDTLVRQYRLPERVIPALADAAIGFRVRNASYRQQADISNTLASQDFARLVKLGIFVATGANKGRSYSASPVLRAIRESVREPSIDLTETADESDLPAQPTGQQVLPGFWEDG